MPIYTTIFIVYLGYSSAAKTDFFPTDVTFFEMVILKWISVESRNLNFQMK